MEHSLTRVSFFLSLLKLIREKNAACYVPEKPQSVTSSVLKTFAFPMTENVCSTALPPETPSVNVTENVAISASAVQNLVQVTKEIITY